jgi:hypothetical protein
MLAHPIVETPTTPPTDAQQDVILAEGIGRLCEDLAVDPSDIVMVRAVCQGRLVVLA